MKKKNISKVCEQISRGICWLCIKKWLVISLFFFSRSYFWVYRYFYECTSWNSSVIICPAGILIYIYILQVPTLEGNRLVAYLTEDHIDMLLFNQTVFCSVYACINSNCTSTQGPARLSNKLTAGVQVEFVDT